MNIVISACPMGMCATHVRTGQDNNKDRRKWSTVRYLAKICRSGVAPTVQLPYPALRCGMDVHAIPVCH
jgi:hypothetical protein